jgi:hypothetical protein
MRIPPLIALFVELLMQVKPHDRRSRRSRAPMVILSEIVFFAAISCMALAAAFAFAVAWIVSRDNLRDFAAACSFACLLNFLLFWVRLGRELDGFAASSSPRPLDRPANDR